MCSTCFAQEHVNKDSIQICYSKVIDAIGGQDHCITIYFEGSSIFCQRICYSLFNDIHKYIDPKLALSHYEESQKRAILRHYQESNNYLILDEQIEISKSQLDELVKIVDEIRLHVPKGKPDPDEIIISTSRIHYVIKDKSGTTVIFD